MVTDSVIEIAWVRPKTLVIRMHDSQSKLERATFQNIKISSSRTQYSRSSSSSIHKDVSSLLQERNTSFFVVVVIVARVRALWMGMHH